MFLGLNYNMGFIKKIIIWGIILVVGYFILMNVNWLGILEKILFK